MRACVLAGGTAVVTGAASGIGEALAHALARRGSHLVLVDRDAGRLSDVAAAIRGGSSTLRVETHVVDLADSDATTHTAYAVLREHPQIRLLVNNAGVLLGGRFDQVTLEEFNWVMDINFRAMVYLTHILLPALKAEPGSHLVNVSSLFGLIAPAGQAAYAASKFAVRGFTEALRHEFADNGIGVTSVHPGGIRTRIAESARVGSGVGLSHEEEDYARAQCAALLTIDPAHAADIIVNGIEHRRGRVLIGRPAKALDLLARLLPASHGKILAAATRTLTKSANAARRPMPVTGTDQSR
ncbi:MAG TPA: SDR family NAD(P)-dependent oxidoreductase [Pseudonocardiaceae bacterium]|nr:SDR family NAD(P)-dependent oxidoreductase [Pseudonocardiaceae bacterium]